MKNFSAYITEHLSLKLLQKIRIAKILLTSRATACSLLNDLITYQNGHKIRVLPVNKYFSVVA